MTAAVDYQTTVATTLPPGTCWAGSPVTLVVTVTDGYTGQNVDVSAPAFLVGPRGGGTQTIVGSRVALGLYECQVSLYGDPQTLALWAYDFTSTSPVTAVSGSFLVRGLASDPNPVPPPAPGSGYYTQAQVDALFASNDAALVQQETVTAVDQEDGTVILTQGA